MKPTCPCDLYKHILEQLSDHPTLLFCNQMSNAAHECCAIALLLHLTTCEDPLGFLEEARQQFRQSFRDYPRVVEMCAKKCYNNGSAT